MHVTFGTASTVKRGSLIACVLFVASGLLGDCTAAADSTTSVSDDLRNHVVEILRGGLDENDWRTRVQAAEALLKLDYPDGFVDAFQQEAEQVTAAPNERVAFYRLMAMASHGEVARARWISQLRDIWLSSNSGRTASAKALLQLGFSVSDEDRDRLNSADVTQSSFFDHLLLASEDTPRLNEVLLSSLRSSSPDQVGEIAELIVDRSFPLGPDLSSAIGDVRSDNLSGVPFFWAAKILADPGGSAAIAELRRLVQHQDVEIRRQACQALAAVGTNADVPQLVQLLADDAPRVSLAAAEAICRIDRRRIHRLGWLDWTMIGLYAALMLGIGVYYARRTSNTEEYLLGNRSIPSWQAGLSLFASLLSTVTYLAIPGEMIKHGPMFLSGTFSAPIVILIVGWLVIPFVMKLRVTTAYEILERRLGLSMRLLGSVYFLLLRLMWMAVIIYATTDKVLVPVLGVDTHVAPLISIALGILTVVYTSMGGLRAVVVSDVIQSFILFGGALLSLLLITIQLGGVQAWWPSVWEPHWDKPAVWFDPEARITVAAAVMSVTLWWVCTASSDQVAVQRYLSTRDVKAARGALISSEIAGPLVMVTLGVLGFALLALYQANPHMIPDGKRVYGDSDQLFAHFIVFGLPPGVSGLVVAGLLAAAMSSLSSGVNSTGSVVIVDFVQRFREQSVSDSAQVRLAKWTSVVVGVVVITLSLGVGSVEGNLLELANKITNLLVVPLFILFFMAMLVPWATPFGTAVGSFASLGMAVATAYFEIWNLNFMWMMPVSFVTGIVVGPLVSLFPIGRRRV